MVLATLGTASVGGVTGYKQGHGGTQVNGAAGPGGASAHSGIQRCDKPMDALASRV